VCSKIRVSSATASVLRLKREKLLVKPTTAYLMTPERCSGGCSFCSQTQKDDRLSRVVWPLFPVKDVLEALSENKEKFVNICIQTTKSKDYFNKVKRIAKKLIETCSDSCNINISIDLFYREKEIVDLFKLGVNRISLAIDCVSEKHFSKVKNGDPDKKFDFLLKTGEKFPGKISTHIIVGLGETDREILEKVSLLLENGISCGLFALTPFPGKKRTLTIKRYRGIQACLYLMKKGELNLNDVIFEEDGKLKNIPKRYHNDLTDGEFFRTSGCSGCNRPFYNEKITELWYNFPGKPKDKEIRQSLEIIDDLFI